MAQQFHFWVDTQKKRHRLADIYKSVFLTALFTTAKKVEVAQASISDGCTHKMWSTHTTVFSLKKEERSETSYKMDEF